MITIAEYDQQALKLKLKGEERNLMAEKYLIVGLGNIGRQYERTRHNVGFWVVDELARRHAISVNTAERKARVGDGLIRSKRGILAKPTTMMNLSGEAVRALLDYYKIPLENFIVIHDDLDTPLGSLRLRKTGGHGGQNGVRNILLHLGTEAFARVRFGIGRPPGRMASRDYVLHPFYGDDAILAQQVVERAADAVERWLVDGIDLAMTAFNGDISQPKQPAGPAPDEAIAIARRAHELAPTDPKPLEQLARLYKQQRDLPAAIEAHLKLAELHRVQGHIRPMLFEYENALALRPALLDIQAVVAREYEQLGDARKAVQRWLKLAEYHLQQGEQDPARQAIVQALRLNPQHPKAQDLMLQLERQTHN